MLPHSVVIDKNDRVYVGDRENARIQIFDTDGHFLTQWTGIGYPYGLWIAPDQHVWMVDGGFDRIIELDQAGKFQAERRVCLPLAGLANEVAHSEHGVDAIALLQTRRSRMAVAGR